MKRFVLRYPAFRLERERHVASRDGVSHAPCPIANAFHTVGAHLNSLKEQVREHVRL